MMLAVFSHQAPQQEKQGIDCKLKSGICLKNKRASPTRPHIRINAVNVGGNPSGNASIMTERGQVLKSIVEPWTWLIRPIPQVLRPDIGVCCIWIGREKVRVRKERVIGSKRVDLGGNAWCRQGVHPWWALMSLNKARGRQRGRPRVLKNNKQTSGSSY